MIWQEDMLKAVNSYFLTQKIEEDDIYIVSSFYLDSYININLECNSEKFWVLINPIKQNKYCIHIYHINYIYNENKEVKRIDTISTKVYVSSINIDIVSKIKKAIREIAFNDKVFDDLH